MIFKYESAKKHLLGKVREGENWANEQRQRIMGQGGELFSGLAIR